MEEGETESQTDQTPSVLEVPAVNWAKYVGVKSVHYIIMGHEPKVDTEEPNDWDRGNGNAVRHRLAITHDGDNKRPKTSQNARLLRETTARQNARQIVFLQKEDINQIQAGFLRRPNICPKELEDNGHQLLTQGTSSHKQNVNGGKTLLVATDYRSHTEQM